MKKKLYRFLFYKILGWHLQGNIAPELKKCIIIVAPHTSWHDFYIGLFVRGILDLEINFVAKKELFRFPFGYFFSWMGGAPLDRSGKRNTVDTIAGILESKEVFRLAIAPEGTRKKVAQWKTGFYFIAQKAQVPIIPVAFDFGKKEVCIGNPFWITNNYQDDLELLMSFYKNREGKIPENNFYIQKK